MDQQAGMEATDSERCGQKRSLSVTPASQRPGKRKGQGLVPLQDMTRLQAVLAQIQTPAPADVAGQSESQIFSRALSLIMSENR